MKNILAILAVSLILALPCPAQEAPPGREPSSATAPKDRAELVSETLLLKVPLASPLFSNVPVAVVNGEPITVEDLKESIGTIHEGMKEGNTPAHKRYGDLIQRLITVRLIVEEAEATGMNELPEVKKAVEVFARNTLLELLQDERTKAVEPDDEQVEKLYKEMVKQYRISSVLTDDEEDAKRLAEEIKAGRTFEEATGAARQAGTLKGDEQGVLVKPKDLLPQLLEAISRMQVGSVSSIIKIGSEKNPDYVLMKLEGIEYPEDPKALHDAREEVLKRNKIEELVRFNKELSKKYVKVNKKLVEGLDFEAKTPGFEALLKDTRVIAEVKGDKPVTVGDLAKVLKERYFHGIDEAIQSKKVNKKKIDALESILGKRVLRLEALKQGIDKTEKYRRLVNDYERSVLFGVFLQKAVAPTIKIGEEDAKRYYEDHKAEFTYPEMMKLQSLAFSKIENARSALEKLQKGAEFSWVKTNAVGEVAKGPKPLLQFTGEAVVTGELDDGLRKALRGAKTDESRLYEDPGGIFYLLYVQQLIPQEVRPFEEVHEEIAKRVFNQKVVEAIEDWGKKLREASDITVYATDHELPERAR